MYTELIKAGFGIYGLIIVAGIITLYVLKIKFRTTTKKNTKKSTIKEKDMLKRMLTKDYSEITEEYKGIETLTIKNIQSNSERIPTTTKELFPFLSKSNELNTKNASKVKDTTELLSEEIEETKGENQSTAPKETEELNQETELLEAEELKEDSQVEQLIEDENPTDKLEVE